MEENSYKNSEIKHNHNNSSNLEENTLLSNKIHYQPQQIIPKNMNQIQDYNQDVQEPSSSYEQFLQNQEVIDSEKKQQIQQPIKLEDLNIKNDTVTDRNQSDEKLINDIQNYNNNQDIIHEKQSNMEKSNKKMQKSGNQLIDFDQNDKASFQYTDQILTESFLNKNKENKTMETIEDSEDYEDLQDMEKFKKHNQNNRNKDIDWAKYFELREEIHETDRTNREEKMREKLTYLQRIQKDKTTYDYKKLKHSQKMELKIIKQRFAQQLKYQEEYKQQFDNIPQLDLDILVKQKGHSLNAQNALMFIKRFVKKIKLFAPRKDSQNLQKQQLKLIGDLSFTKLNDAFKKKGRNSQKRELFQKGQSFVNVITGKSVSHKCVNLFNKLPLILPSSIPKIIWDIIIILLLIITLWMYPIDLILGKDDMHSLYGIRWAIFNISVLVFYIADIIGKFQTAYYKRAVCITDKTNIIMNYFQGWFYYDLISLLPFIMELFQIRSSFKFWNLLVFMKLPTFFQIMNNVNDIVLTKQKLQNIVQLFRLFLFVTFVAHIFGLIWLGQTELLMNNNLTENNWILDQDLGDQYWLVQYIWCFYFAITTMTTVGYGDVTPTNEYEAILLVIGMVLATAIFAYTFNSIGQIIEDLTRENKEFKKQASLVNIYLKKKNTPSILKLQVHKYLEYKFQSEKELSNEEENMVMSKLPENMQEEILFEQAMYIIKSNKNIFGKFTEKVQQRLAMKIQERRYNKHENFFEQNENVNDPCLYFIQSGKVEIFTHSYKGDQQFTIQNILKDRQSFGEYSFFTGYPRTCGAQTLKASQMSFIRRSDLLEVIQRSVVDQEVYCMMRDKIILQDSNLALGTLCYSCNQYGHFSGKCPMTHVKIDKEKVILQQKFQNWQIRNYTYVRCERIKYHTLLDKMLINERGEDFFYEQNQQHEQQEIIRKQQEYLQKTNQNKKSILQESQKQIQKNSIFSLDQSYNEKHMIGERNLQQKRQTITVQRKQQEQKGISYKNNQILKYLIEQKVKDLQGKDDQLSQVNEDQQNEETPMNYKNDKQYINYLAQYQDQFSNNSNVRLVQEPIQNYMVHHNTSDSNQKQNPNYQHNQGQKKGGLGKFLKRKNQNHDLNEKRNSKNMIVNTNKNIINEQQYLKDLLQLDQYTSKGERKLSTKRLIFRDNDLDDETPIEDIQQENEFMNSSYQQQQQNNDISEQQKYLQYLQMQQQQQLQQQYLQQQLQQQQTIQNYDPQQYIPTENSNFTEQKRNSIISNNDTMSIVQPNIRRRSSRRYSVKFTNKIENNLVKKKEQLKHKTMQQLHLAHYNRIQIEQNIVADCTIKKFDKYFPQFNFSPEEMTKKYNWVQENIIKTPGFGIYTLYERKIRHKNYQTYQTTLHYEKELAIQGKQNIRLRKFRSPNSSIDSSLDEIEGDFQKGKDSLQVNQLNNNINKEQKSLDFLQKRKAMQSI